MIIGWCTELLSYSECRRPAVLSSSDKRVSHTDRHRHSHIAQGTEVSHDIMSVAVLSGDLHRLLAIHGCRALDCGVSLPDVV